MTEVHQGIVLGSDIRLTRASGFPAGQSVEVTIRPVDSAPIKTDFNPLSEADQKRYEEVILATAGAWADDPEDLETMLTELRKWRHSDRPPIEP